jgi:hypothetical protein
MSKILSVWSLRLAQHKSFALSLRLTRHKSVEFQISRWDDVDPFGFELNRRRDCDHPGVEVCLTLFRRELRVDYYDHRHREDI